MNSTNTNSVPMATHSIYGMTNLLWRQYHPLGEHYHQRQGLTATPAMFSKRHAAVVQRSLLPSCTRQCYGFNAVSKPDFTNITTVGNPIADCGKHHRRACQAESTTTGIFR